MSLTVLWQREIKHCCVGVRMGGDVEKNLLFPGFIKIGRNWRCYIQTRGVVLWQLGGVTSLLCKSTTYINLCQWLLNLLKEKSLWSPLWHERVAQKGEEFLRKEKDRGSEGRTDWELQGLFTLIHQFWWSLRGLTILGWWMNLIVPGG